MEQHVAIRVYGAETVCASCVNLPSAKETQEWLEAAISRKYNQSIQIDYVDIYNPPDDEEISRFAMKVIDEDLFYPVVTIGDKIVGEGNPRLKDIYEEMEKRGYSAV